MIADKRWSKLGWKHPLWDIVRYYLSLRGTKLPTAFRETLSQEKKVLVAGQTEFPIAPEVCGLFAEYIEYRAAQFSTTFAKLRTESEALAHCPKLGASVSKTKTKQDHHQSSSALVASVSAIAKSVCDELSEELDTKPQTRCVWCLNSGLHVSVRNLDGAVPGLFNPKVIWEIKEYWGKTSGGSKMSDAVYECHLVGLEVRNFEESAKCKILHVAFVDGKEQWTARKSDLSRFLDLLNQGLIDHLFVGKDIETDWKPSLTQMLKKSETKKKSK